MKPPAYEAAFRAWLAARGMGHERLRYARPAAGGETVAYRLTPARAPHARVLVAHGAGNDALFGLVGWFKELLLGGYEVFSFDLDGHGRHGTTRFSAAVRGALPDALEQAQRERADLPVHAVGLSLGGAVLLDALAGPLAGRVRTAALIAAPLRVRFGAREVRAELRPGLLRAALRQRRHLGLWGMVPSFGPLKRGLYPLRLAEPEAGAFGYVRTINALLDTLVLPAAAERLRIPVLLVYGTADRVVPFAQGEELARRIPHSELLAVPRGTHLTTPFAPEVIARLLAWLRKSTHSSSEYVGADRVVTAG